MTTVFFGTFFIITGTILEDMGKSHASNLKRVTGFITLVIGLCCVIVGTFNIQTEITPPEAPPESNLRIFKVTTRALGSGNVVQLATNATSFMGVGVVKVTSSFVPNLLGDRAVLMSPSLKIGEFVSINRVTIDTGGEPLRFSLPIAERETNEVVSAAMP